MKIVFLVEEQSMEYLLNGILPRVLPSGIDFKVVPHQGKQHLQKSIPIKLRNWTEPNIRFIIVHDKDSWDCKVLKQELIDLSKQAGRADTLVRIACVEMEAWYFGDLEAVGQAFDKDISKYIRKGKYRIPDSIQNPKAEIKKIIPNLQQISAAIEISSHMNIEKNTSHSFNVFLEGVLIVANEMLNKNL